MIFFFSRLVFFHRCITRLFRDGESVTIVTSNLGRATPIDTVFERHSHTESSTKASFRLLLVHKFPYFRACARSPIVSLLQYIV